MDKNIKLLLENLFDDSDIFKSNDSFDYDDISNNILSLSYDTSLLNTIIEELNINKPKGFKLIKHTNNTYDFLYYLRGFYINKYFSDLVNTLKEHNWKIYNNNIPKNIYNEIHEYIDKLKIYDRSNITIKNIDDIKTLYISPNNKLFLASINGNFIDNKKPNDVYRWISIFSFGDLKQKNTIEQTTIDNKLKNIKQRENQISQFKQLINLKLICQSWLTYNVKIDKDNYPYIEIPYFKPDLSEKGRLLFTKKTWKSYYEEPISEPDSLSEYSCSVSPYIRIYFKPNNNITNTNEKYLVLLKLTDEGKKELDQICK